MDFFGVPVSDQKLLEAPAVGVLAIARRFVDSITYNSHLRRLSSGSDEEVMQSFFEVLAGMTSERQDECFHALVTELTYCEHVIDRLKEGKVPLLPLLLKEMHTNPEAFRSVRTL